MNKTKITYDLCEHILQTYGVELYNTPEIKAVVRKIMKESLQSKTK